MTCGNTRSLYDIIRFGDTETYTIRDEIEGPAVLECEIMIQELARTGNLRLKERYI